MILLNEDEVFSPHKLGVGTLGADGFLFMVKNQYFQAQKKKKNWVQGVARGPPWHKLGLWVMVCYGANDPWAYCLDFPRIFGLRFRFICLKSLPFPHGEWIISSSHILPDISNHASYSWLSAQTELRVMKKQLMENSFSFSFTSLLKKAFWEKLAGMIPRPSWMLLMKVIVNAAALQQAVHHRASGVKGTRLISLKQCEKVGLCQCQILHPEGSGKSLEIKWWASAAIWWSSHL